MLLGIRDDKTTRRAAATEFARFIYEFQSSAPALAEEAYKALRGLGVEPGPSVGGGVFRGLAAIIGFERAMKMRSSLSRP
jgi:hypothetical protein